MRDNHESIMKRYLIEIELVLLRCILTSGQSCFFKAARPSAGSRKNGRKLELARDIHCPEQSVRRRHLVSADRIRACFKTRKLCAKCQYGKLII